MILGKDEFIQLSLALVKTLVKNLFRTYSASKLDEETRHKGIRDIFGTIMDLRNIDPVAAIDLLYEIATDDGLHPEISREALETLCFLANKEVKHEEMVRYTEKLGLEKLKQMAIQNIQKSTQPEKSEEQREHEKTGG